MSKRLGMAALLVGVFLAALGGGTWWQHRVQQAVKKVLAPEPSVEQALIDELQSMVPPLKEQREKVERVHLELSRLPIMDSPSEDQYRRAVEAAEDGNDLVAECVDRRIAIKKDHASLLVDKASKLSVALEETKDVEGKLAVVVDRLEQQLPVRLAEEIKAGNSLSTRLAIMVARVRERRAQVAKIATALSSLPAVGKERDALVAKSLADSAVTKKFIGEIDSELTAINKEVDDVPPSKPKRQRLSRRCSEIIKELKALLEALNKVDSELRKLAP